MSKQKNIFKFICKECGKEFKGNKEKSNKNWCICTKEDRCECGGELDMVPNKQEG